MKYMQNHIPYFKHTMLGNIYISDILFFVNIIIVWLADFEVFLDFEKFILKKIFFLI